MSVSALVGENALFHCNGSGATIVWRVDRLQENEASIIQRQLQYVDLKYLCTIKSPAP